MNCYGALAPFYDRLTEDVDYSSFADWYESVFRENGGQFHLLLDLCCGTGSLTAEMAMRGYELIGVDASEKMLMEAREKCCDLPVSPLFILQNAEELDLYGTVDAAYCSLEGLNYLSPVSLSRMLQRLKFFIRPGGLFLFDIRDTAFLKDLDGSTFVDEDEDLLCLWRADFDEKLGALIYGMDLFSRVNHLWKREREEHIEYAHPKKTLLHELEENGFVLLSETKQDDRMQYIAEKK